MWDSRRPVGGLPTRDDIDPGALPDGLDYAFTLERIAPGVSRFRLVGGHMAQVMRMELRGMPVTALAQPAFRAEMGRQVDRVFQMPATLEMHLQRADLRADMLILPLGDGDTAPHRAVGALVARDGSLPGSDAMARFAVMGQRLTPVRAPVAAQPRHAAMAEPAAPFAAGPGRAYLRVVK